ncbi:MAG: lipopolysaccharide biosynthesis protein [Sphingomonas bacterium]|nr:lipopolysaccharide biosynthesis protein [Sphingomonas bacterium]
MPSATLPAPSGLKRIFGNLGLLLGGKAGAGVISLAYLAIVARTLGASDYGVLILIHAYVTLVGGIVAFSGWHGLVRFGSMALEQGDHQRLLKIGRFLTLVEACFGVAAIFIAIVLVPVVGPHMGWPPDALRFAAFYSLATLANVRSTPLGLLQLSGRFDLIAWHHLVSPTVRLCGSVFVWWSGGGLVDFLIVWLIAAIAEWAGMWAFGLWILRGMKLAGRWRGPVRGTIAENDGLLRFIVTTNVDITLRELAPRLVPLAIGWVIGPAAAGLFSLAQRASIVLEQPAALLGQASYSVMAKLVAARDRSGLSRLVWHSAAAAMLLSIPVLVLLAFFSTPLLALLGGQSFRGGAPLLILLALARAVALGAPPLTSALIAMGFPSRSISVNLFGTLMLFPLLPVLLNQLGLNGAGWHALLVAGVSLLALAMWFRLTIRRIA